MKIKQLSLNLNQGKWGGRRHGSGRKRIHSRGVAHKTREKVTVRTPLHVNFKYRTSIKNKESLRILKRAVMNARSLGLRVIHFSMQSNHLHFILEADNNKILTKGMRSLTITFAKGLKKGRVQIERYHLHVLKSVKETKNAIHYVLFNQQKHEKGTYSKIDRYSSLLSTSNALKIIQNYARESKITLRIERNETWILDAGNSYFLKQGHLQL